MKCQRKHKYAVVNKWKSRREGEREKEGSGEKEMDVHHQIRTDVM